MKNITFLLLIILIAFSACSKNIFKRADVKDVPINVNERVQKNVEEGRGIRFGTGGSKSGVFDFASANELWRASIETLDFVPFTNASYSGGILITDWFDGNSTVSDVKRDLKITVRFLSNDIRADALTISIHERKCKDNFNNCNVNKIKSKLVNDLKLAILKRAAYLEKTKTDKNVDEFRKKRPKGVFPKDSGGQ